MISQVLLISSLMGSLAAAGGATETTSAFNWADVGGKNFMPPMASAVESLEEIRCFDRAVNAAMEGAMAAALNEPGYHINLSDQYSFQCGNINGNKCSTNDVYEAVCTQAKLGITDENCVPMAETTNVNSCSNNNCSDISKRLVKATDCDVVSASNETNLKKLLLEHGPIAVTMRFYESFKDYTKGIYTKAENDTSLGIYTVTLTGWELSNDLSAPEALFIARNDFWGSSWGNKGYFRIKASDMNAFNFGDYTTWFDYTGVTDLPGHICVDQSTTIDLGEISKFEPDNGTSISIRNCGQQAVNWSIANVGPLKFTPPAGALGAGEESSLKIYVDVDSEKAVDGKFNYAANIHSTMSHDTELTIKGSIFAPEEPVVDFTATPYGGYAPLKVKFTNTTKGGEVTKFAWTFGENGATSNLENPEYEYVNPGDYDVTLTITWAGGEITKEKKGVIAVYAPKGETSSDSTQDVDTGCNATSSSELSLWVLLALFFMLIPQKRLN